MRIHPIAQNTFLEMGFRLMLPASTEIRRPDNVCAKTYKYDIISQYIEPFPNNDFRLLSITSSGIKLIYEPISAVWDLQRGKFFSIEQKRDKAVSKPTL